MLASIRNTLFRKTVRPTLTRFVSTPTSTQHTHPIQLAQNGQSDVPPTSEKLDPNGLLVNILESVTDSAPSEPAQWRTFRVGDMLKPSDLSRAKCSGKRSSTHRPIVGPPAPMARYNDMFHQLNLDPVDFALNPAVLHAYISEMGKIYGRNVTGLTSRSQRRLGKAIRRARMIGILPHLSRPSHAWVNTQYRRTK